tara:strand:+ start:7447 stop:8643 length:1197 start_codon:yes stop_codon:yes gene_type:complete
MKIGCFLSDVSTGGGHYLTKDFAKNIFKLNDNEHQIILINSAKNLNIFLEKNNLRHLNLKFNYIDKFLLRFWNVNFIRFFFNFFGIRSPIKNFVKKHKFDLLIFNSPSAYILHCKNVKFIASIWNTEIDNFKRFIEFNKKNFNYQKTIINKIVKDSYRLFVFTEKNKEDLINRFNCKEKKILIQNVKPFFPAIYENTREKGVFDKDYKELKLNKNKKWIFYPAQFWSHKNHEYIIDSIEEIDKLKTQNINFIFCGRDKGHLNQIKDKIARKNLSNRFKIFDYLDDNKVISLYLFSYALIIPTYVGRTTMPLLEGLYFNKKIFYGKDILDKKFYNYVSGIDLKNPKDFAEKLHKFVNINPTKDLNFKEIYKKECSDELFLSRYREVLKQFKQDDAYNCC